MHYYSPHTGEHIATDTPSDWMASTEIAPPRAGMFFKDGAWAEPPESTEPNPRITEIKSQLNLLDQKKIRPLANGDAAYLADLNVQSDMLRTELGALE